MKQHKVSTKIHLQIIHLFVKYCRKSLLIKVHIDAIMFFFNKVI